MLTPQSANSSDLARRHPLRAPKIPASDRLELPPASERRPAALAAPETIFWRGLVSGAFLVVETRCDLACCVAVARERGAEGPGLSSFEQLLLHRVFQGDAQKTVALDFEISTAAVSQLLGSALLKLGLGRRVSATPLPVVLSALRHAGVIGLPAACFARYEREGQERLQFTLSPLDPEMVGELSYTERHIALMLAWGASYRQIAESRGTSHCTVANQIGSLGRKLGTHGRFELIRCWAQRQWGVGAP